MLEDRSQQTIVGMSNPVHSLLLQVKFYGNTALFVNLHMVYGFFHAQQPGCIVPTESIA